VSENLLDAYKITPSFALWDDEHAILSFTGKLIPNFEKEDKNGQVQIYLGIEVFLKKHSNENYSHRHESICILRTGPTSTLAKWATDEQGGIKATDSKLIFRVGNSKKLGFSLRIENMVQK
jgi:hypothetical protein